MGEYAADFEGDAMNARLVETQVESQVKKAGAWCLVGMQVESQVLGA